jgi:hypothetical protein
VAAPRSVATLHKIRFLGTAGAPNFFFQISVSHIFWAADGESLSQVPLPFRIRNLYFLSSFVVPVLENRGVWIGCALYLFERI